VSSEALTFALLGAWGAAPKMTCLISTVGGAATAGAAAAREAHHEQQHGQQSTGEAQQPTAAVGPFRSRHGCANAVNVLLCVHCACLTPMLGGQHTRCCASSALWEGQQQQQ
jgi:hypothetical protein